MHEQPSAHPDAPDSRSRWRRRPRVLVAGALVIGLVAGVAVWLLLGRDDDSAAVTTTTTKELVTVTRGPLTETISAEGTVAAAQTDDLSFGASGTVTAVNVSAGDKVTAGQVLATLGLGEPAVRRRRGGLDARRCAGDARRRPVVGRVEHADRSGPDAQCRARRTRWPARSRHSPAPPHRDLRRHGHEVNVTRR